MFRTGGLAALERINRSEGWMLSPHHPLQQPSTWVPRYGSAFPTFADMGMCQQSVNYNCKGSLTWQSFYCNPSFFVLAIAVLFAVPGTCRAFQIHC